MTRWYRLVWLNDLTCLAIIRKSENTMAGSGLLGLELCITLDSILILGDALKNLGRPYGWQNATKCYKCAGVYGSIQNSLQPFWHCLTVNL